MLKIKIIELDFEVILTIQNALSQTHGQLESLLAPPCSSGDFLKKPLFVMTERGRKRKYGK